jgi:hypothetical protein
MFSTVYRVTQRGFYAHPYTSMWARVVAHLTYTEMLTTFLDETFPGRWVGRGVPTAWPHGGNPRTYYEGQ